MEKLKNFSKIRGKIQQRLGFRFPKPQGIGQEMQESSSLINAFYCITIKSIQ